MALEAKLLDLIGEVHGLLDLDELIDGLLAAFARQLPSDYVSINDIGPDPARVISVIVPPQPQELYRAYGELAMQNPLTARYVETLDGRAYRLSDVASRSEYHALELYRRVYGPMGVEYQIAFTLPATPGRILAIALSRRDRDYSDQERDLVDLARPFLIQSWRTALAHTALQDELAERPRSAQADGSGLVAGLRERGLTQRQAEVLALVAQGRSNRDAAVILGISDRTVQKHLELCFRILDVRDRSAASELAWASARAPEPPEVRRGLDGRPHP